MKINDLIKNYDPENITLGIFGSHSAKPLGVAAKSAGMRTVIVVEKGRDELYAIHNRHLYDKIILVDRFKDILQYEYQNVLRELNTVFVFNRSFATYLPIDEIEKKFRVAVYGNRFLPRLEGRDESPNQYDIMDKAGVKRPPQFTPDNIDKKIIAKIQQRRDSQERFIFYATTPDEFYSQVKEFKEKGILSEEELKKAVIEEFIEGGVKFNANFHVYGLKDKFGEFDFVGTSDREQIEKTMEEAAHTGKTARESFQPMFYEAAKKLISTLYKEKPPGIIGPLGIQGIIRANPDTRKPEFLAWDLSFRVTGDPIIGPTSPEMRNLSLKHKRKIEDPLDLVVMEIQEAAKTGRIEEIVS